MPARERSRLEGGCRQAHRSEHRPRRALASLLGIALAATVMAPAADAAARGVAEPPGNQSFGLAPLSDGELADLRGGFNLGGFDVSVGIVARSVVEQALGGLGGRLEVVTRFSVPEIGQLASHGTTVTMLDSAGAGGGAGGGPLAQIAPATTGFSISTGVGTTMVDLGTTRLSHQLLNTFVENTDLDRVINNQLDINLDIGGFARHLSALRSVQALRPAVDAQIAYGNR